MLKSTITTLFVLNAAILTFALSAPTTFAQKADADKTSMDKRDELPNPPDQRPSKKVENRIDDEDSNDESETGAGRGQGARAEAAPQPSAPDTRPSKKVDNRIDDEDSNDESETGAGRGKGARSEAAPRPRPSAPSFATSFGKGTPGSAGRLLMGLASAPRLGNRNFAIVGKNAPARSVGALLVAPAAAAVYGGSDPLGNGLVVYVDVLSHSTALIEGLASDTAGQWELPAPLPSDPALADMKIVMQSLWHDSNKGKLASSNGLEFRIQ